MYFSACARLYNCRYEYEYKSDWCSSYMKRSGVESSLRLESEVEEMVNLQTTAAGV